MALDIKELMSKVGRIRVLTDRLVDDELSGNYHSTFKGQGVEFDEVRPYEIGDDVRSIDWNVTARTGVPYIKRFSEERELTILFLVDISGSQNYGSSERTKAELAAEVASLLALTAIRNQDKVGLILFSDKIVKYLPPRKGRDSVMRLVREVLAAGDGAEGGTDAAGAIRFLDGVRKRRAVVFLVSDFIFPNVSADSRETIERMMRAMARRHDLVAIKVYDVRDAELPDMGLVEMTDSESDARVWVDTSSAAVREHYTKAWRERHETADKILSRARIDHADITTDEDYVKELIKLFKRR